MRLYITHRPVLMTLLAKAINQDLGSTITTSMTCKKMALSD
jgi:hypothetical protein